MDKKTHNTQKLLHVTWQRLLDDAAVTCPRCSDTEKNLYAAVNILQPLLAQQGIHILLQKKSILPLAFSQNPMASNLILIEGRPLENWINAETGKSKCCDVCGDNECRTLIFEENVYEDVPVKLIVRGILKAVGMIFNIQIDNEDTYIIRSTE